MYGVRLPDVGEGIAEAELIEWHVRVGDRVTEESVLAEVLTDKATVEIASPVTGTVTFLHGEPGDRLAVGAEFVGIELEGTAPAQAAAVPAPPAVTSPTPPAVTSPTPPATATGSRATAAPAVRARARALGIDLAAITGSGPQGRVLHDDLDRHLAGATASPAAAVAAVAAVVPRTEAVRGLRRRIAERLTASWTQIPHITYVDDIDATELESLRAELNRRGHPSGVHLTLLPFLVRALVTACGEQPRLNATYDAAAEMLSMYDAVHVGIATQTPNGLVVPVVHHAEGRRLWELAGEIGRVTAAARDGTATLETLTGSTITITSLGALGGLATTPIINQPEVAIIGVNRMETRPVWRNDTFEPRLMFNLSSSFDHRIVDGWDAATFVQRIKSLLELPALLFVDDEG